MGHRPDLPTPFIFAAQEALINPEDSNDTECPELPPSQSLCVAAGILHASISRQAPAWPVHLDALYALLSLPIGKASCVPGPSGYWRCTLPVNTHRCGLFFPCSYRSSAASAGFVSCLGSFSSGRGRRPSVPELHLLFSDSLSSLTHASLCPSSPFFTLRVCCARLTMLTVDVLSCLSHLQVDTALSHTSISLLS